MIGRVVSLLAFLGTQQVADAPAPDKPMPPLSAVALADAARRPQQGRFEMTVAATGQERGTTYLNSEGDYRSPTDLTFQLHPNVVRSLAKRFGTSPAAFLRGKHVVVNGSVGRELIVNTVNGHPVSTNRWQHIVQVIFPSQVIAVD